MSYSRLVRVGTGDENKWCLGSVEIHPHIMSDKLYTQEELYSKTNQIISKMASKFPQYKMNHYPSNNQYCCEVNGRWAVVMYISIDGKLYHYMLRRDKDFGQSFGCPVLNVEYIYDLKNQLFCESSMKKIDPTIWTVFETCVMEALESDTKINRFQS